MIKLSTRQSVILALLFSGGLINYMDRAAFAILAPQISADLKLDAAELGLAFSFFSFGHTAFCFFGGWAADKFGARRTLAVSMVVWSLFCGATGAVISLFSLLVVRTLFGIGEAPWMGSVSKTLAESFSKERFASAFGMANSGQPLGGVFAGPLLGIVSVTMGWRWSFGLIALIGLAWVACWVLFTRDQPESDIENEKIAAPLSNHTSADSAAKDPLLKIILQPTVLATAVCLFTATYLLFFFLSWFPTYLTQVYQMKLSDMSLASAVPWLLGVFGLTAGGFICDALIRWVGSPLLARKLVLVFGLCTAAVSVMLAGNATSPATAVTFMAIGVGAMYLAGPTYFAIALEAVPARNMGSVSGFLVFIANFGGIIAPAATGYIIRGTGEFSTAFYVAGFVVLTGAALVALFVRRLPQVAGELKEA